MKPWAMRISSALALGFLLLAATGCGNLMGNLRKDLDDGDTYNDPVTVGGNWQERGFLSESMGESGRGGSFSSLNHADRNPASLGGGESRGGWNSEEDIDQQRRDAMRGGEDGENLPPSYQSNPNLPYAGRRNFKGGARASRADFVDESQSEGSLWASDGQTNYYFTKNKVRSPGDIITVKLEAEMVRDFGLEVRRTLSPPERKKELEVAQNRLRLTALGAATSDKDNKNQDTVATGAAAPERKPAAEVEVPTATFADIDVSKAVEVKENDTVMAEIVERYPNGNYKIRGTKKVNYKNGTPRLMTMIAVVRGQDIGEDDSVASGKLYEYRLEALR